MYLDYSTLGFNLQISLFRCLNFWNLTWKLNFWDLTYVWERKKKKKKVKLSCEEKKKMN